MVAVLNKSTKIMKALYKLATYMSMAFLLTLPHTQAQSRPLKAQETTQETEQPPFETSREPGGGQAETQPRAELPKVVRGYATHLRELAQQAQAIETRIPQTPQEGVSNLWAFKEVLTQTRDTLVDIVKRQDQIGKEKDRVLEAASQVEQSFINLAKKIDADAEELQRRTHEHPAATQVVVQGHNAAKAAAERGATLVATLREQVTKDSLQVESTLAELAEYRKLFDNLIEVCRLYIQGIGDTAEYNSMVEALTQARQALRQVVHSFAEAASNAEKAAIKVPPQLPPID